MPLRHPNDDTPGGGTRFRMGKFKTGWWLGHPSEKYQSIGMIIPNIWENKIDVPNHQPENGRSRLGWTMPGMPPGSPRAGLSTCPALLRRVLPQAPETAAGPLKQGNPPKQTSCQETHNFESPRFGQFIPPIYGDVLDGLLLLSPHQ